MMKIKFVTSILLFLISMNLVTAFNFSSGSYKGELTILDSGGSNITSGTYKTDIALSQFGFTNISSGTYRTQLGVLSFIRPSVVSVISEVSPIPPPTSGAGKGAVLYYDIIVIMKQGSYKAGEYAEAFITIANKGYTPDRDSELTYYLALNNQTITGRKLIIEQTPPISFDRVNCERHIYSDFTNNQCLTIIEAKVYIPKDAKSGRAMFVVEYDTQIQPLLKSFDSFEVEKIEKPKPLLYTPLTEAYIPANFYLGNTDEKSESYFNLMRLFFTSTIDEVGNVFSKGFRIVTWILILILIIALIIALNFAKLMIKMKKAKNMMVNYFKRRREEI